jgi:hypothetical protein
MFPFQARSTPSTNQSESNRALLTAGVEDPRSHLGYLKVYNEEVQKQRPFGLKKSRGEESSSQENPQARLSQAPSYYCTIECLDSKAREGVHFFASGTAPTFPPFDPICGWGHCIAVWRKKVKSIQSLTDQTDPMQGNGAHRHRLPQTGDPQERSGANLLRQM